VNDKGVKHFQQTSKSRRGGEKKQVTKGEIVKYRLEELTQTEKNPTGRKGVFRKRLSGKRKNIKTTMTLG